MKPMPPLERQRGQSMPGYAVVLAVCAILLFTGFPNPGDPSPIERLSKALRGWYAEYSYILSLP